MRNYFAPTSAMAIPLPQINMNTAPLPRKVLPLGMPQERLYTIPPYMVREYRDSLLFNHKRSKIKLQRKSSTQASEK